MFSGPADSKIYVMSSPNSTGFYLTCTDESEFSDSNIATTDFTVGTEEMVSPTAATGPSLSSEPVVTIGSVTKTAITGGYKYTVTVNASYAGSAVLTLKTGAISDKYGNSNAEAVSESIRVSFGSTS